MSVRYERTDEFRPPKKGEIFMEGGQRMRALDDQTGSRLILRRIEEPGEPTPYDGSNFDGTLKGCPDLVGAGVENPQAEIEKLRRIEEPKLTTERIDAGDYTPQDVIDLMDSANGWMLRIVGTAKENKRLRATIMDAAREIERLRGELAEVYDGVVRQDGHLIADGGDLDGWWDSQALSHVAEAGDRLVELGLWEIHPDGVGRRQFYRPKTQEAE